MKHIKFVVLSLLALAFARPPGLCTANVADDKTKTIPPENAPSTDAEIKKLKERLQAQEEEISKLRKAPDNSAEIAAMKKRLAAQEDEIDELRSAQSAGTVTTPEEPQSEVALLCRGAGVDPSEVLWRVRAGLSPKQAVEVASLEKAEREEAAKKKEAKK